MSISYKKYIMLNLVTSDQTTQYEDTKMFVGQVCDVGTSVSYKEAARNIRLYIDIFYSLIEIGQSK